MGTHRTPTAVLKLRGADKVNPGRMANRKHEPRPDKPLGSCPKKFGEWQTQVSAAWRFIAGCCPAGVLTEMDRPVMMQASALMAEFWADPFAFPPPKHARLESILSKLGMTPVDRSKVTVIPKDKSSDNPFARFRAG